MKRKAGFTLIEMMITVGIIGILASVALPTFSTYKQAVYNAEADMMLSAMFKGANTYFQEERMVERDLQEYVSNPSGGGVPSGTHCILSEGLAGGSYETSIPDGDALFDFAALGPGAKIHIDFAGNVIYQAMGFAGAADFYHAYNVQVTSTGSDCLLGDNPNDHEGQVDYLLGAARMYTPDSFKAGMVAVTRQGDQLVRTPGVQWWGPFEMSDAEAAVGTMLSAYSSP